MTDDLKKISDSLEGDRELRPERLGSRAELRPERLGGREETGPDSIHVHGGLLYSGPELPGVEEFRAWARELEGKTSANLEGISVEPKTHFHLVLHLGDHPGDPLSFEVRAEVHAVLGPR